MSNLTNNIPLKNLSTIDEIYHYGIQPSGHYADEKFFFANRLLLFTAYSFLPYSSGKLQFKDDPKNRILTSLNTTRKFETLLEIDAQPSMNGRHTIHHKLPYFLANQALKISHISDEWCRSSRLFHLGFRIHQSFKESGLPVEIACAACHPTIQGLPTFYYLFPERDFIQEFGKLQLFSRPEINDPLYCETSDCEKNPRMATLLGYFMKMSQKLSTQKFESHQYLSRWNGEQTPFENDRKLQGIPDGKLWMQPEIFDKMRMEFKMFGMTTMCAMELDDKIIGSNVFVNTDFIGKEKKEKGSPRSSEVFRYSHYETFNVVQQSVKFPNFNLEIFVNWQNWTCCSACCCPASICGYEHQTATNCESVYSSKSRKGLLSIRKIDKNELLRTKKFVNALDRILSLPPYTQTGVPIYSTLVQGPLFNEVIAEIQGEMLRRFLIANKNENYQMSSGIFIESISCKSDPQKLDCLEWAKCQGVELDANFHDNSGDGADLCSQIQFVDVLIGKKDEKIVTNLNENLRIRMDPEVHDMQAIQAEWRVNMKKPEKYDTDKPCHSQNIVIRNNEILIIRLKNFRIKIDLLLNSKQKIRISFKNASNQRDNETVYWTVLYWSMALTVFFTMLISFVIFMHRQKTRRIENILKQRLNEKGVL